jgi:hypothetical protein
MGLRRGRRERLGDLRIPATPHQPGAGDHQHPSETYAPNSMAATTHELCPTGTCSTIHRTPRFGTTVFTRPTAKQPTTTPYTDHEALPRHRIAR